MNWRLAALLAYLALLGVVGFSIGWSVGKTYVPEQPKNLQEKTQ